MNAAVKITDLTVKYGENTALENVCLDVEEGEFLGIIGPNGGGKTTLIKAILGLVDYSSGEVRVLGKKPYERSGEVGYVPQLTVFDRSFPITVHEVVMSGRIDPRIRIFHRYSSEDSVLADHYLESTGISGLGKRQISELSGGEFQKMLIARALVIKPRLLLLDEPTASVDAAAREQIFELLGELSKKITIILVTHDLLAISQKVRSLACLNKNLVYHGGTKFNEDVVKTMYGCPIDLIAHGVPHRVLREHDTEE
jgi:zinc transport system ATP-binding protein